MVNTSTYMYIEIIKSDEMYKVTTCTCIFKVTVKLLFILWFQGPF